MVHSTRKRKIGEAQSSRQDQTSENEPESSNSAAQEQEKILLTPPRCSPSGAFGIGEWWGMLSPITPSKATDLLYPFICGDSKGNIANPDNVAMMDDFDTLLIGGEDMMSVPSKNVKEEVATEPRNAKRKKKETRTLRNASQDASSKQRKCKSPVPSFTFAKSPTLQNKKTRIRRLDFGDEAKFMSPQSHQSDLMMPKTPGESGRSAKRRRSVASGKCNCKKSKCLKLYCECFAAGRYCLPDCMCQSCGNLESNKKVVEETRNSIIQRDPLAFQPKILAKDSRHKKGCNCKRSHCLKKYCECFQAGIYCSDVCKCEGCKNMPDGSEDGSFPKKDMNVVNVVDNASEKRIEMIYTMKETAGKSWSPRSSKISLLKKITPNTPQKNKRLFQVYSSILRPPPSPLIS